MYQNVKKGKMFNLSKYQSWKRMNIIYYVYSDFHKICIHPIQLW